MVSTLDNFESYNTHETNKQPARHATTTNVFSTGCPTKNYTLFWRAVAPLNFELGIKVGGVLELSASQL